MKLGRSIAAYLPVNLATALVAFGGLAVLTRVLEPAAYGRYAIAMVTLNFVHMFFFTWLEASIARFQARAEEDGDEATYLRTIYTVAGGLAVAGVALASAVLWLLPLDAPLKTVLLAAIVSTGVQLSLNLGFEAHKASHRILRYSALDTSHRVISFGIGLLLVIATPLKESGMFVGIMASALVIGLLDIPFMLRKTKGGRVEPARLRRYLMYGAPISMSLVLSYALNSGDVFLITHFLGEAEAGTYSAGYNLANRGLDMVFIWIGMAMTPILVTAFERDGEAASVEVMRSYAETLLWVVLPAATGIALVAEPLGFIIGEEVRDGAVMIMAPIAFAGMLNGLISYYAQRAFMLTQKTGQFAALLTIPVVLNIVMNIVLIPMHGLMGAVAATIAAYAVGLVIAIVAARRDYPLPLPVKAFLQVTLACAVMAAAVLSLPDSWDALPDALEVVVKAGIGASVYTLVCFATDTAGCRGLARNLFGSLRRTPALEAAE